MAEEVFWVDKIAKEVIEREKHLNRGLKKYTCEMGLGASGIPHVGSAGDGVRSYVVYLALKKLGKNAEFIAFADDRDGLRKVPAGFPDSLEKDIGKPVSLIKDPFKCHKSFAEHMEAIIIDAFKKIDVKFKFKRGHLEYAKGTFDSETIKILTKAEETGRIIEETTNSTKFREGRLPFFPICKKCGSIVTTHAYKFIPETKKILYKCDDEFVGKNSGTGKEILVKGCGYEGECGIRDGKLAWKVEFGARWSALKINYEAYGKDLIESVRCNDRICKDILGFEPPVHSFYEFFTERSGKRISKSAGNVFTVQNWLKYASPESIRLLYLKKLSKTRVVDADSIPAYQDEVDELAKIYFGEVKVKIPTDLTHFKRLYDYSYFLNPPKKKPILIQYGVLANLMNLVRDKELVKQALIKTGHIKRKLSAVQGKLLNEKLDNVNNWIQDTADVEEVKIKLNDLQKTALHKIAYKLKEKDWKEDDLLQEIYAIGKELNIQSGDLFRAAYLTLLKSERGPRLAQLILAIGRKKVAEIFETV